MYQGTVKKITEKGYGFITCGEVAKDVFFHIKNMAKGASFESLQEGDPVSFDVEENDKGFNALNVSHSA